MSISGKASAMPTNAEAIVAGVVAYVMALPGDLARVERKLDQVLAEFRALRAQSPPRLGSKRDGAAALGISLSKFERMIAAGEVNVTKIGRSVRVDMAALAVLRPADEEQIAQAARRVRGV
jgi:excisionase family DNA binding protein